MANAKIAEARGKRGKCVARLLQPIEVFRAYQKITHCSLIGLRNILTSIAKKRIEAHARHDVGVLPCYAGANNCRLSG